MITDIHREEHSTHIIQTRALSHDWGSSPGFEFLARLNDLCGKGIPYASWHTAYVGIPTSPLLESLTGEYDSENAPPSLYSAMHSIPGGCTFLLNARDRAWRPDPSLNALFPPTHVWFGWDTAHGATPETHNELLAKTRDWASSLLASLPS